MDAVKNFLVGFLVRWLLKIGGTFFATIGMESGQLTEIVGGIVAIVIGVVISLWQHKKALDTPTS